MSNKLTVIIFSNRIDRLLQIKDYWMELPYEVVIADGSKTSNKELFESNEKISYVWWPNVNFKERIAKALELTNSQYTLLAPDDDFFFEVGIEKCIEFLDVNIEYSAASGWFYGFSDKSLSSISLRYNQNYDVDYYASNAVERLEKNMQHYHPWVYCVFRTKEVREIIESFAGDYRESVIAEFIITYSCLIAGNVKFVPEVFMARESIHPANPIRLDIVRKRSRIEDNGYKDFIETVVKNIERKDNLGHCAAKIRVEKAINGYCNNIRRKRHNSWMFDHIILYNKIVGTINIIKNKKSGVINNNYEYAYTVNLEVFKKKIREYFEKVSYDFDL